MRLFDHHIHSTRSDGTVSLEDRAKSVVVRPHGLSDHYPWPTGMHRDDDVLHYIAASFQNKGFEYAKVLYDNQGTEDSGWLTDTVMKTIAASVNGLNLHQWSTDTSGSRAGAIAHGVDVLVLGVAHGILNCANR